MHIHLITLRKQLKKTGIRILTLVDDVRDLRGPQGKEVLPVAQTRILFPVEREKCREFEGDSCGSFFPLKKRL